MFNINGLELLLIAVLFLLLFGPDRLPSVVVDIMNAVRQLRAAAETATDDLTREFQAAARDVREVQRTVEEAGTSARRLVEETGADARRLVEEVAEMPQIAPPALQAVVEADASADPAAPSDAPTDEGGATEARPNKARSERSARDDRGDGPR